MPFASHIISCRIHCSKTFKSLLCKSLGRFCMLAFRESLGSLAEEFFLEIKGLWGRQRARSGPFTLSYGGSTGVVGQ